MTTKRRLLGCVIMGGVPLLIAIVVFVVRFLGMIENDNLIKLSNVIISGGIITVILSVLAACHIWAERRTIELLKRIASKSD